MEDGDPIAYSVQWDHQYSSQKRNSQQSCIIAYILFTDTILFTVESENRTHAVKTHTYFYSTVQWAAVESCIKTGEFVCLHTESFC